MASSGDYQPLLERLLEANLAYYDAFEQGDLDAMAELWEHSEVAICGHPGWRPIHGWAFVKAAWYALFTNGEQLHFLLADVHAHVHGEIGMVSCIEEIIDGDLPGRVAAFNVFALDEGGRWRMRVHVGSSIAR